MKQSIGHLSLVVSDYDIAIDFFVNKLSFQLVEDTYSEEQNKRWVIVAPLGSAASSSTTLLLAKAKNEAEHRAVGNQTGGRVFLFLQTDDFWRDYHSYKDKGVEFIEYPRDEAYGTVAVFKDLYGNLWDLLQYK